MGNSRISSVRGLPSTEEKMSPLEDFVFFLFSSPTTLLGAVAVLLVLCLVSSSFTSQEIGRKPPGPRPLPLLGNLLQLDLKRPDKTLFELSKQYGSVFTVYFGTKKVVVLAGYKTVKEALVSYAEEFGDRDISPIFYDILQGHGILFANGESWKEMRRFALSTLRDFGMGKRVAEDKILEECCHLIQLFDEYKGKPFDTTCPVNYATSNIISSIVYGSRFEYSDPRFKTLVRRANENIRITGSAPIQLYNMFPWLFSWIKNRQLILKNVEMTVRDVRDLIKHLKETLNPHICRGLVDCFLIRKKKEEDSHIIDTHYNEKNLIFTVTNLFVAGTDTTATTLRWGLLLMAKYPQIQDKVQDELSRVVGSRQIRVDDRKNLPYTDAVIHETQRLASILPMSLPHKTSRDVIFQGYFVKRGTIVFPLLTSVLYDESEWESPHTFNPSHFLDKEGKFIRRDAFMPFSAGRRVCLGESLAKMKLFLFFTTLLQRFRFTPPPAVTEDDLDLTPAVGFVLSPSPHELCAVSRQASKKYGSVFTVYFGTKKVVVLAGYKTIKEALVSYAEEFGDRDIAPVFMMPIEVMEIGREPQGPRPLPLLGNLLQLDLKRPYKTLCESLTVLPWMYKESFDTTCPVNYATSNIISSIVYGSRFEYSDPRFKNLVRQANEIIRINGSAPVRLYNMFPRLLSWIKNRKLILKNVEMTVRDVKDLIKHLKETLNPHICRGLVDCFLIRKKKEEDSHIIDTHYHEKNLIITVMDLFAAGTDTTATTLRWGLLLMAKYPQIQDKVQDELSRVVGNRQIRVDDRKNLPYIDAVIHETQRLASIVPMSLPHITSRDVTFQGYFIKEGTAVFPLLTSVLYDESEWESPHMFNPSHFLDKEGKFIRRDAFMVFSAGRRVCLGESLAKMELFLFFTTLLQCFRFTPPPAVTEDDLDLTPAVGFILSPSPHELCAVSRQ
ncbi:cytochrome P450 2K1-like [Thunnus thynnus]|uniref:cytochrome P450 2K1-like n=1 Tax=Thunnus thynnus TaxID=8237 RepID=UPI003527E72B